jgi:hypothetical protein
MFYNIVHRSDKKLKSPDRGKSEEKNTKIRESETSPAKKKMGPKSKSKP